MTRNQRPRKFRNVSDELNYCSDDVIELMRNNLISSAKGRRKVSRFKQLLDSKGDDDGSILVPRYWALYYRCINDERKALPYLIREIQLLERLFEISGPLDGQFDPINHDFMNREIKIAAAICKRLQCTDLREWLTGKIKKGRIRKVKRERR